MRQSWTLLAVAATALSAHDVSVEAEREPAVAITAVAVEHAAGRAELVVELSGKYTVLDFTLESPNRVVLDFEDTRLGLAPMTYDRVTRGGITNVRFGQPKEGAVRVVVDLDARRTYTLARLDGKVRVTFDAPTADFSQWRVAQDPVDQAMSVATGGVPMMVAASVMDTLSVAPGQLQLAVATSTTSANVPQAGSTQMFAARPTFGGAAPVQPQSQERRLTVSYRGNELSDVIRLIAVFAGRSIVVSDNVKGTVNAEIVDIPWDVALKQILEPFGLTAIEGPNGLLRIDSYRNLLVKQASEPLADTLIRVNYSRAASLAGSLRGLLYRDCSGSPATSAPGPGEVAPPPGTGGTERAMPANCVIRGSVIADTTTNALIISEVASRLPDMLAYVQALDIRTPQVSIKAKIIFVDRTDLQEMGIQYDLGSQTQFNNRLVQRVDPNTLKPTDTNGDGIPDVLGGGSLFSQNQTVIDLGGNALSAVVNASQRIAAPALDLIFSTALGKFDLTAFLTALQEVRLADVQAEPQITTLDNKEAIIFVGTETPIRIIQPTPVGNGALPVAQTQFKESGIILRVTPHVTADRQVLLQLHSERSSPQLASFDFGFEFSKQSGTSNLLVADGETAVIAGLTVTEVQVSKVGIPLLVDLPLIGRLFGQTRRQEIKRDLLMLVTPHIVDPGQAVRPGGPGGDR